MRRKSIAIKSNQVSFNPRTHKGCDPSSIVNSPVPFVSIHAPTKGATAVNKNYKILPNVSIHAPTKGATHAPYCSGHIIRFQSTHPQRVRHNLLSRFMALRSFNPRTHKGCDRIQRGCTRRQQCFNPRTHKGCDSITGVFAKQSEVSIHAPTKGATLCCS